MGGYCADCISRKLKAHTIYLILIYQQKEFTAIQTFHELENICEFQEFWQLKPSDKRGMLGRVGEHCAYCISRPQLGYIVDRPTQLICISDIFC